MKIFASDRYPPSRHSCSTTPCAEFYIYPDAIIIDLLPLFSIKFSTSSLEVPLEPKRIIKFLKKLEKIRKGGEEI
jgi:hypothetical protein